MSADNHKAHLSPENKKPAGVDAGKKKPAEGLPAFVYETDAALSQYLEAHWGQTYFGVENFPVSCVEQCLKYLKGRPKKRALDLGCAVGRASFELAWTFDSVTGLDYSKSFIQAAKQMQQKGVVRYKLVEEGKIVSTHQKHLADFGLEKIADKVEFFQGDAANLPAKFKNYDLILAANLIDRLSDPKKFLNQIHTRLNIGGLLVLTSPYTWLEEFTPPANWLGGTIKDGKPYKTLQGLKDTLKPHFKPIASPKDIPFVLKETSRKFQHTLSQMTFWEKRN